MSDEQEVGRTVTKQESTAVFKGSPKWYERFQWPQLILTLIVAGMVWFAGSVSAWAIEPSMSSG